MTTTSTTFLYTFIFITIGCVAGEDPRNAEALARCIRLAEPLVYNYENVFPLSVNEIRSVCRMWEGFDNCVQQYTEDFLYLEQRVSFQKAIAPSMNSIHKLCDETGEYQQNYLSFVPCMKKVAISPEICGYHYRYMADLVQGNNNHDSSLCCSLSKFRKCVKDQTALQCDAISNSVSAVEFVSTMMDRGFGFLLQQCKEYNITNENCPRSDGLSNTHIDTTDGYGRTQPDRTNNYGFNNLFSSNSRNPTTGSTRFTWTTPTAGSPFISNHIDGPQPFVDNPDSSAPNLSLQFIIVFTTILLCSVFR